eukprot:1126543-Pleurochrysis_carterae.AAC.1
MAIPLLIGLAAVAAALYPTGYFGPLSARVRGLFVKHTRTGNPLVDSVAEHQPANEQARRVCVLARFFGMSGAGSQSEDREGGQEQTERQSR